jgi:hypothetical protein
MASSLRIAIAIDDESQRKRFAAHLGPGVRIQEVSGGDELRSLAAARAVDVAVAGVLNSNDEFLPSALREMSRTAPEVMIVGVFEVSRPSLDEATELAREIPAMGFACRADARFDYLVARQPGSPGPSFTAALLTSMSRLPLYGAARSFARLQALHPSVELGIPEQARALGVSRRNLERWFQGPDIASAGSFQSISAAAEAAYLRIVRGMPEHEVATVLGMLTRDGVANPLAVPRLIRGALQVGLDELRSGGTPALVEAMDAAFRTSRDPTRIPAQWGPHTRYAPEPGVLTVPVADHLTLMDAARGLEHPLDEFGMEGWPLLVRGVPFGKLTRELASTRREPPHVVRARLISWLGQLLTLRLIRREPGGVEAGEA